MDYPLANDVFDFEILKYFEAEYVTPADLKEKLHTTDILVKSFNAKFEEQNRKISELLGNNDSINNKYIEKLIELSTVKNQYSDTLNKYTQLDSDTSKKIAELKKQIEEVSTLENATKGHVKQLKGLNDDLEIEKLRCIGELEKSIAEKNRKLKKLRTSLDRTEENKKELFSFIEQLGRKAVALSRDEVDRLNKYQKQARIVNKQPEGSNTQEFKYMENNPLSITNFISKSDGSCACKLIPSIKHIATVDTSVQFNNVEESHNDKLKPKRPQTSNSVISPIKICTPTKRDIGISTENWVNSKTYKNASVCTDRQITKDVGVNTDCVDPSPPEEENIPDSMIESIFKEMKSVKMLSPIPWSESDESETFKPRLKRKHWVPIKKKGIHKGYLKQIHLLKERLVHHKYLCKNLFAMHEAKIASFQKLFSNGAIKIISSQNSNKSSIHKRILDDKEFDVKLKDLKISVDKSWVTDLVACYIKREEPIKDDNKKAEESSILSNNVHTSDAVADHESIRIEQNISNVTCKSNFEVLENGISELDHSSSDIDCISNINDDVNAKNQPIYEVDSQDCDISEKLSNVEDKNIVRKSSVSRFKDLFGDGSDSESIDCEDAHYKSFSNLRKTDDLSNDASIVGCGSLIKDNMEVYDESSISNDSINTSATIDQESIQMSGEIEEKSIDINLKSNHEVKIVSKLDEPLIQKDVCDINCFSTVADANDKISEKYSNVSQHCEDDKFVNNSDLLKEPINVKNNTTPNFNEFLGDVSDTESIEDNVISENTKKRRKGVESAAPNKIRKIDDKSIEDHKKIIEYKQSEESVINSSKKRISHQNNIKIVIPRPEVKTVFKRPVRRSPRVNKLALSEKSEKVEDLVVTNPTKQNDMEICKTVSKLNNQQKCAISKQDVKMHNENLESRTQVSYDDLAATSEPEEKGSQGLDESLFQNEVENAFFLLVQEFLQNNIKPTKFLDTGEVLVVHGLMIKYLTVSITMELLDELISKVQDYHQNVVVEATVKYLMHLPSGTGTMLHIPMMHTMTYTVQTCLCFLRRLVAIPPLHYKQDTFDLLLKNIEYRLFNLSTRPEAKAIEYLTHFYIIVCHVLNQNHRLKLLCANALYCLNYRALPIVSKVLKSWPYMLPSTNYYLAKDPLVIVMVHLMKLISSRDKDNKYHIGVLINKKYGYENTDYNDDTVLNILLEHLNQINNELSMKMAFILFAKKCGTDWCYKKILLENFLPMMEDQTVHSNKRAFIIRLIGPLTKPFPNIMTMQCEIIIQKLLAVFNRKESHIIEEAVIQSLTYFSKKNFNEVLYEIINWKPKEKLSAELTKRLNVIITEKCKKFWKNKLMKKNKSKRSEPTV